MSTQNAGALSSTDTENSTVPIETSDETIERLCEIYEETETDALTDMLFDVVHDLIESSKQKDTRIDELESLVGALRKKSKHQEKTNQVHESRLDSQNKAIEDLEDQSSDAAPEGQADHTPDAETSLEQIVALPEHMVEEQLSANQERARFIAKDFEDYSQNCPAGRYIEAREMRRVIHAMNGKCNTNTLSRVRTFLDRLGDDEVKIVERRGTKKVVFTDELVERLQTLRRRNPEQASNRNRAAI